MSAHDPAAIAERIRDALRCGRSGCSCARPGPTGPTHCPAHDDRRPSLAIDVRDGQVLWHCHTTGCDQRAVTDALRQRGLWPVPAGRENGRGRETRYELRDEAGQLVAVHVRLDTPAGKVMWWEQPDGARGLGGRPTAALPLYRVDRLNGAERVVLCEGEKAAEALAALGVAAVGTVTGAAGTPSEESLRLLVGRTVYLWPDNDGAGRRHMARIAARLLALGADQEQIRWVEWPAAPEGGDAADFVAAGRGADDVERLLLDAGQVPPPATGTGTPSNPTPEEGDGRHARSQAERLLELVADVELFRDQHGAPFALVDGEPVPLGERTGAGGDWLRRVYWHAERKPARGEAVTQALDTLRARALFEGGERTLHVRAAWHDGALYYELRPRRVVRVTATGWTFDPDPPVLFRHFPNGKPLPDPEPGGSLDALLTFLNVKDPRDRRLLLAAIVLLPLPHIARPIIEFTGEMGSGKTLGHRIVKRLWDPTAPETIRLDPRDALQKASHAFVLMVDNSSTLPEWATDMLCRLVTGEGDSKRRLYSDDDDVVYELRRAVLLNGLSSPSMRADLQDRVLAVELQRLRPEERREEHELLAAFERERPRLLAAAFDVLARALRVHPHVRLPGLPRLADWGRWAAAVYEAIGWGADRFLADWDGIEHRQQASALEGSVVAQVVLAFMQHRTSWTGAATALHAELKRVAEDVSLHPDRNPAWPKTPSVLSRRLREVGPALEARGITITKVHTEQGAEFTLRRTAPQQPPDPGPGHGTGADDGTSRAEGRDRGGHGPTNAVRAVRAVSADSEAARAADGMGGAADGIAPAGTVQPSAVAPCPEHGTGPADATDATDGISGAVTASANAGRTSGPPRRSHLVDEAGRLGLERFDGQPGAERDGEGAGADDLPFEGARGAGLAAAAVAAIVLDTAERWEWPRRAVAGRVVAGPEGWRAFVSVATEDELWEALAVLE